MSIEATRTLFDACEKLNKIHTDPMPISAGHRQIAQAISAVRTMGTGKPSAYLFTHLPKEKLNEFFMEMQKLPPSEQQFMLQQGAIQFPKLSLLLSKMGLNGFFMCEKGELVPSFGMMETLLKVKFNADLHLNPAYITTKSPLPLLMLARLHLAYAIYSASPEKPSIPPLNDEESRELQQALALMPNDPMLQLLAHPVSKL